MLLTLCIELHYFDWLGCGWGSIIHGSKLMRALASESWMGAVAAGVSRILNLFDEEALACDVVGGLTWLVLGLDFLGLTLVQG